MNTKETQQKMHAAYTLLSEPTTSREKFEHVRTLISGINPKVDDAISRCSSALSDYEKLQKGEVIDLTIEHLPEDTEENKKRKKALLAFLRAWKDLHSEIERIQKEFERSNNNARDSSSSGQIDTFGRILLHAKGPFGIITFLALIVVGTGAFISSNTPNPKQQPQVLPASTAGEGKRVKVIIFKDKQIALTELRTGIGSECDSQTNQFQHYHAKEADSAVAFDGTTIPDPGGCGYGKVDETKIVEVEQN